MAVADIIGITLISLLFLLIVDCFYELLGKKAIKNLFKIIPDVLNNTKLLKQNFFGLNEIYGEYRGREVSCRVRRGMLCGAPPDKETWIIPKYSRYTYRLELKMKLKSSPPTPIVNKVLFYVGLRPTKHAYISNGWVFFDFKRYFCFPYCTFKEWINRRKELRGVFINENFMRKALDELYEVAEKIDSGPL